MVCASALSFLDGKIYTVQEPPIIIIIENNTSNFTLETKWALPTQTNATHALQMKLATLNIFFACTKIKPVWRMVELEISKRIGTRLEISETIALLGFLDNTHTAQEQKIINELILIAEMFISKCRYVNRSNRDIIFDTELAFRSHILG